MEFPLSFAECMLKNEYLVSNLLLFKQKINLICKVVIYGFDRQNSKCELIKRRWK